MDINWITTNGLPELINYLTAIRIFPLYSHEHLTFFMNSRVVSW